MSSSFGQHNLSRRIKGMLLVLLVHVLIGYALVSGTARQGLNLVRKPLEAVLIQEVIIPPSAPTPPKMVKPRQQTILKVPAPLPYVPPPEAPVATSVPVPVIAAATQPAPTPARIQAPAEVAPQPQSAAPASNPSRSDMAIACPIQVPPEMPRRALRDGTQGVVRAQALISNGMVKDVVILSGPPVFHSAVRAAMLQYKCTQGGAEVIAVQEFNFRIE